MFEIKEMTKSFLTPSGRKYIFRNLNLTVPKDRNIGLIGKNGAGKSTLMRLLGGADMPDSGSIRASGSISWPVGLAGCFQGSLSGRDNVKFVSRVYGAVGSDMNKKIEYVRDFAEIGDWFDEPVRTYSSGMRSRLAFGLSMAFDFDYYLIDEVMSVGDSHFKDKCSSVFKEKMKKSNVVLVTHNMTDLTALCDMVLHVTNGRVDVYDNVQQGIDAYRA